MLNDAGVLLRAQNAFVEAAKGSMKGILSVTSDPVVSSDFVHDPHSCIFDSTATTQLNNQFVKVLGWYVHNPARHGHNLHMESMCFERLRTQITCVFVSESAQSGS